MPSERSRSRRKLAGPAGAKADKSADKPGNKPVTKVVAKPAARAGAKPPAKAALKPVTKIAAKPAVKPAAKPAPEPAEPEPEPLDPKVASRAIKLHLEKKKATRTIERPAESPPAPAGEAGRDPETEETTLSPQAAAPAPEKPLPPPAIGGTPRKRQETAHAGAIAAPKTHPVPRAAAPAPALPEKREPGASRVSRENPEEAPKTACFAAEGTEAGKIPEEALKGKRVSDRELIVLIEQSTGSLAEEWIKIQAGDNAQPAVKVSKVEVEFLLLKKTVME